MRHLFVVLREHHQNRNCYGQRLHYMLYLTFPIYQCRAMSMSKINAIIDYIIDINVYAIFLFRNYSIEDTRKPQNRGVISF